jgi:hypothetical protein
LPEDGSGPAGGRHDASLIVGEAIIRRNRRELPGFAPTASQSRRTVSREFCYEHSAF